jgi:HlyD family secretion protein
VQQGEARVAELEASVQVARLPSRSDERAAADAQVEAARQVLPRTPGASSRRGRRRRPMRWSATPSFANGEFVNAGQPVLSLLPPGN